MLRSTNSQRQCYFLNLSLLSEPHTPPTCPLLSDFSVGKAIQPHIPIHLTIFLFLALSAHTSGARWCLKLQLCFFAEKLCSIHFLISPSCPLGPKQKYGLCKFALDVVSPAATVSVLLVSLTNAHAWKMVNLKSHEGSDYSALLQRAKSRLDRVSVFCCVMMNVLSFVLLVLHLVIIINSEFLNLTKFYKTLKNILSDENCELFHREEFLMSLLQFYTSHYLFSGIIIAPVWCVPIAVMVADETGCALWPEQSYGSVNQPADMTSSLSLITHFPLFLGCQHSVGWVGRVGGDLWS